MKYLQTTLPIVNEVLNKSKDFVDNIINEIEGDMVKKNHLPFNERDRELIYLNIVFKLVESLSKNIHKEDILKSLAVKTSGGKLAINACIERGGQDYHLSTESILAGGHSIQSLHRRYITKTNLPTVDNSGVVKQVKEKISKLTKIQQLENDLRCFDLRTYKNEEKLKTLLAKTNEEILAVEDSYNRCKEQGRRPELFIGKDLPGQIHESQETFDTFMKEWEVSILNRHKRDIEFITSDIKNVIGYRAHVVKKIQKLA